MRAEYFTYRPVRAFLDALAQIATRLAARSLVLDGLRFPRPCIIACRAAGGFQKSKRAQP